MRRSPAPLCGCAAYGPGPSSLTVSMVSVSKVSVVGPFAHGDSHHTIVVTHTQPPEPNRDTWGGTTRVPHGDNACNFTPPRGRTSFGDGREHPGGRAAHCGTAEADTSRTGSAPASQANKGQPRRRGVSPWAIWAINPSLPFTYWGRVNILQPARHMWGSPQECLGGHGFSTNPRPREYTGQ
jgi:hypothetical protein